MARLRNVDQVRFRSSSVRDQHGREWDVLLDPETFIPCTLPIPKFAAPLAVPAHALTFSADHLGHCVIQYDAWAAQWEQADEAYSRALRQEAQRRFGTLAPAALAEKMPELMDAVGEPPQSVDFVRAAAAGNRWVLGLPHPETGKPYAPPAWAVPLLDRIAPRWQQELPGARKARWTADASKYRDEDGAPPAETDAAFGTAGAGGALGTATGARGDAASAFADEEDFDRLVGTSAAAVADGDPDGLAEIATPRTRRR